MTHEEELELEERLNRLCLLWDSPPKMMPDGMDDPAPTATRGLPPAHHYRPYHRHQTGQLYRSSPVHTFGH
jgi:hypothetical protein